MYALLLLLLLAACCLRGLLGCCEFVTLIVAVRGLEGVQGNKERKGRIGSESAWDGVHVVWYMGRYGVTCMGGRGWMNVRVRA